MRAGLVGCRESRRPKDEKGEAGWFRPVSCILGVVPKPPRRPPFPRPFLPFDPRDYWYRERDLLPLLLACDETEDGEGKAGSSLRVAKARRGTEGY